MRLRKVIYLLSVELCPIVTLLLLLEGLSSVTAAPSEFSNEPTIPTTVASDSWRVLADMQLGRGDPGVAKYGNEIYVVSGFFSPGFNYVNAVEVYNPLSNKWETRYGVPQPRGDLMAANVGDKIYVIGGLREGLGVFGLNHEYDPLMNTWKPMTSMITPVSGAGVAVMNDNIYIIGGFDGTDGVASVQIYDPAHDSWSEGAPMPESRSELGAVALGGMIYAIGGNRPGGTSNPSTDIVEVYDPASDSWSNGTALPEPRASMAVAVRDGKIYVIGGTANWAVKDPVATAYVYDPATGMWSATAPMPTARYATEAAAIGDLIYVVGGVGPAGAGKANEGFGFEPFATTTAITADDPDPSPVDQSFTVDFMVTSTGGVPTGIVTVTVASGSETCSGQLVGGIGSCEITLASPGAYTLTASYGGDLSFASSGDTEEHRVVPPPLYIPLVVK